MSPQSLSRSAHGLFLAALLVFSAASARAQVPPQEALQVRITPDTKSVTRGDLVAFTVEIVNTSNLSILRDDSTGGAALLLSLPEGLGFVEGSGTIELSGGQVVRALDPATSRTNPRLVQSRDGNPQTLNLGPNQALRFRYSLRVTPKAAPYTAGEHRAWLATSAGDRLSSDAVARLRVEPDPEMDLAVVLGQVYCDDNNDGERDTNERGVGGVRIAGDHGRVVDTDKDGLYHLRDFRPGAHLVKLDTNTLPPLATPRKDPKRLFDLTGGLLARHDFPITCPKVDRVRPGDLVLKGDDTPAPPVTTSNEWVIRGRASDLSAHWEGSALPARKVTLEVEGDAMTSLGRRERTRSLNLPWRPGPTRSMTFFTGFEGAAPSHPEHVTWQLEVAVVERGSRELVHVFTGQGVPPARIDWDGLDSEGAIGVLKRGQLHEARLIVIDGAGERLESAPVVLGASWSSTGATKELYREVNRERLLSSLDEPTPALVPVLKKMRAFLNKNPGARLVIEVHVGPSGNDENDLVKTRRAAFNIGVYARKEFELGPDRLIAMGFGRTRPLRPNVSERNKVFNRRIEFVVLPPEDEAALVAPPVPTFKPRVHLQGEAVQVAADSTFMFSLTRPEVLALSLESATGARRTVVLGLTGKLEAPKGAGPVNKPPTDPGVDKDGALVAPPPDATDSDTTSGSDTAVAEPLTAMATDPLRRFGGPLLREALGDGSLVVGGEPTTGAVTADDLEVELPPANTVLASPRLFLSGRTNPANSVTVNGVAVRLEKDGRFAELLSLPSNIKSLDIVSTDKAGNVARLSRPLTVKDTELFLLALVDGVGGQLGARLEELETYDRTHNDSLFLAGRGALYAKARISGTALARDLFVTAHVDSTRRHEFSSFFEQVIDPTRDYLIYGDATDDLRDANARGRFYVMVEADRSKVMYGSFRTNIRGLHLLRYDRTFEGAMLDIDTELAKGFRTQVKAHLADDNRRLVRRHDELRATGGSLYYLSSREILEGSDKVELVVRELDTGMELGRTTLVRDVHYRIDYPSGRVMTMGPISSVVDPLFQVAGYQPFTGRAILDGHEVWLDVDYESRAVQAAGDIAWGAQVRQELFDRVEIGAGYIREGRPAGAAGGDNDYVLWGVQARVRLSEKSRVFAEYAEGKDKDGATRVSTDGGIGYRDLDRAPNDNAGSSFRTGFDLEMGEILNIEKLDLRVKAHWQYIDAGYHAVGLASEEGTEKWGGEVMWKPYEAGRVHIRYDGGTVLTEDSDFEDGLRAVVRNRLVARYDHELGLANLYGELGYGQHRDDLDGKVFDTTAVALGASYRLGRFTLMASQEALLGGQDSLIGDGFTDRLTTNVGAEVKIDDDLSLRLGQSVRWNGDNATRFGFVTKLSDNGRAYFEEQIRPGDRNGRLIGSTVIGAEHMLGRDGRIFSEYRLDGGVGGRTNRAVMGLGRTFELVDGVKLRLGYERSQVLDALELGSRGSRDVLSGGLEITGFENFRYSGLYEVRWDRDRPPIEGLDEILQAMLRNTADLKVGDFTVLALFNYMLSQDLDSRAVAREDLEASVGLAYRPLSNDDLILVARYSRLLERRSDTVASLLGETIRSDESRQSDLLSVAAIIELPWRLTLTEKLVWRFNSIGSDADVLEGLDGEEDLLLWLNRLAFNIWGGLDLAGEFRLIASLTDMAIRKNGGLVEVSFEFLEHARVGLGWSIDGHAGGLLPGEEDNDIDNGFFVRMTGTY